jgi:hypothetical protein
MEERVKMVVRVLLAAVLAWALVPTTAFAEEAAGGAQDAAEECLAGQEEAPAAADASVPDAADVEADEGAAADDAPDAGAAPGPDLPTAPDGGMAEGAEGQGAGPYGFGGAQTTRFSEADAQGILDMLWAGLGQGSLDASMSAFDVNEVYVGKVETGTCYIGSHYTSGRYSSFQVTFADDYYSGTVTLWCLDQSAAEPYPQYAPYSARITAIDPATTEVTYSVYITPAGATTGAVDANGYLLGYQHVGGTMRIPRTDPGKVDIQKVDADTGLPAPQGAAAFAGAVYRIANNDTGAHWDITLNELGLGRKDFLPLGNNYACYEVAAPECVSSSIFFQKERTPFPLSAWLIFHFQREGT